MDARIRTLVKRLADDQNLTRDEQRVIAAWSMGCIVDAVANYETTARLNGDRMIQIEARLDQHDKRIPPDDYEKKILRINRILDDQAKELNRQHERHRDFVKATGERFTDASRNRELLSGILRSVQETILGIQDTLAELVKAQGL